MIGLWRFNAGTQGFDGFRPDAPSFANSLNQIDPRDALLVLLFSAADPADAELSIETLALLPVDRAIDLVNVWNQFAFTGAPETAVTELFAGSPLQSAWKFDQAASTWLSYFPGQPEFLSQFTTVSAYDLLFFRTTGTATLTFAESLLAGV